jgi:hypothetical protein
MSTIQRCIFIILLFAAVLIAGCYPYPQTGAERGGAAGAGFGGFAGAILDRENPWRGGLIGAAIGGLFGATLGDISDRGAYESARNDAPVEYLTENGRGRYRADPEDYDPRTKCHRIRERVWEDGRLVKDRVKEVCESEMREKRY